MPTAQDQPLSPLAQEALALYESHLKPLLEPEHTGEAVAVHVDTGDYEVAPTHREAARTLLTRHPPDGRVVTLTIGPATDADLRFASRMMAGRKQ